MRERFGVHVRILRVVHIQVTLVGVGVPGTDLHNLLVGKGGVLVGVGDVVLCSVGSWARRLGGWYRFDIVIVELFPG